MPDDVKVRDKVVPDKYVETDDREKQPHSEQRVWEDARMKTAQWQFGAKDARQKLRQQGKIADDYELLLDDTIDFVQTNQLAGTADVKEGIFGFSFYESLVTAPLVINQYPWIYSDQASRR